MRLTETIMMVVVMLHAAVVIDRIAVVVNRHPIKSSDIERDLRLTDFLNGAPLHPDAAAKKAAEERLIDQEIIHAELATGGYSRASDADADRLLAQIRRDRYAGSDARLRQALERYGLTEDQLHAQLLWQLTVLRFIGERFRPGVQVPDDDVRKYYDQHRASLPASFDAAAPAIRTSLEGEQVNRAFEDWLADARKNAVVDYKPEAIP